MNVIMLVDSNNAYNQRTRHRTLPKAPKDLRSKSLSRKEEGKHSSSVGIMRHSNQLSSSSQQLSGKRETLEAAVELPVIVDEVTKWISGVNKNTTCRDIISVILRRHNQGYKESDVHKYFLCERWKKVDRPLRHSAHLLGIWTAWGQDKQAVRFVLKRAKRERKPARRTDSKLWRKQQTGENSDTKHPVILKPEKTKRSRDDLQEVNDIIKKILKQQTHLRSHIKKLEDKDISHSNNIEKTEETQKQEEDPSETQSEENSDNKRRRESQSEGKGYIMKTFLENVESEDFYSHDSGIGSALATTITDFSITKDSELKSLDTVLLEEGQHCDAQTMDNLSDCIIEIEKIIDMNDKLVDNESQIEDLFRKLEEVKTRLNCQGQEEVDTMQDKVEEVTKINSSKSHEIKKNDIAISHMDKNLQGRQMFLSTIELDINRAESYAKRLQKEFEREFETVGVCNDILTVCNDEGDDIQDDTKNPKEDTCNSNEKVSINPPKPKMEEEPTELIDLGEHTFDSEFSVSATKNPFGS